MVAKYREQRLLICLEFCFGFAVVFVFLFTQLLFVLSLFLVGETSL